MMQNLELESEVLQVALYCNIIKQILFLHRNLSPNKILPFAYLIKNEKYLFKKVYNANNSQDLVYKYLSILSGQYSEYCNSIEFIIKAIQLLIDSDEIALNNNILILKSKLDSDKTLYDKNSFTFNAIEASKQMSEKQFLKEVVQNV